MSQRFTRAPGRLPARVAAPILALALILPQAAGAGLRYVSPSGNDLNSGALPAAPWRTIAKANASLVAGDVCVILPGTYADAIDPARAGASSQLRITFLGSLTSPGSVVVPAIRLRQPYVVVKGVTSTGSAVLSHPALGDSIAWCALGGISFWGAKYSMVARNRIAGRIAFLANEGRACISANGLESQCVANSEYDTLRGNVVDLGVIRGADKAFVVRAFSRHCVVDSNEVSGVFDATGSVVDEPVALIFYNTSHHVFRDNRWTLEARSGLPVNAQWEAFRLRDSTRALVFERDTLFAGVNSAWPIRGLLAASGTFVHTVADNRWSGCFYKFNSYVYNQDALVRCTFENSVVASRDAQALRFQGAFEGSVLRHNVFWSGGEVMNFDRVTGSGSEITSNVFYSRAAAPGGNGSGGQVYFNTGATSGFVSDHNLYFTPSYSNVPGDRSLMWCCYTGSRPGAGEPWNRMNGQDGASRYGSPRFADSTFAGLDARFLPDSPAFGAGVGGSNAGPWTADTAPPAAIRDLRAAP